MGWLCMVICFLFGVTACGALKDSTIHIPNTAIQGTSVFLACTYDLENEKLYSVKWYKGSSEFFRYTPKDKPQFKQFPIKGLDIRALESNSTHVVLDDVSRDSAGYYSCEISADGPSFQTAMSTGYMKVIELPQTDPYITGLKPRYHVGESLRANCTLEESYPAANITWLQNGHVAETRYVKNHQPLFSYTGRYTSHSVLRFTIQKSLFMHKTVDRRRLLKIRCVARIYDMYHRSVEATVQLEKTKKTSSVFLPATSTETTITEENTQEAETIIVAHENNWFQDWTEKFVNSLYSNTAATINKGMKCYMSIFLFTLLLRILKR